MGEVAAADPDVIIVACCGLDDSRADTDIERLADSQAWPTLRAVRSGWVLRFDGSQYSNRSDPRLVESLEMLADSLERATSSDQLTP